MERCMMSDTVFENFAEQVLSLSYDQTIILMEKMLEALKSKKEKKIILKWKMVFAEVL